MEVASQQTGAFHRPGQRNVDTREEAIIIEQILAAERHVRHEIEKEPRSTPSSVSDNEDEKRSSEDERSSGVAVDQIESRKVAYVETSLDDLIYSDHNEASGQSEDEENERRLIERLKLENQQRQMHQLEQRQRQEELARQQQRRQNSAAQVICCHDSSQANASASLRRQSSSGSQQQQQQHAADKATSESECAEEVAPQVPVRRSSRQASLQHPNAATAADNQAPVYSLHHRRLIGLKARGRAAPASLGRAGESEHADLKGKLDYEEEEEDEDDEESLLPPPPRLHAVGTGVLASAAARPPLPPPPLPPPVMADLGRHGKHAHAQPPPPPPPRTRSVQQAPRNIWSPSSSSLASSSLSSEPELELDPVPGGAQEVAQIAAASNGSEGDQRGRAAMTQRREGLPISQASQAHRGHTGETSGSNELEEEDEQATIVERHLQADAANSSENRPGARGESGLLRHNNSQASDSIERQDVATSIEAREASSSADNGDTGRTMARMPAGNKSDVDGNELPPPIEHQDKLNLQLPKGNLRSFSISSPTNLTTSQQEQQLAGESHQLSSANRAALAGLSSFVGGPAAGRSSRRSPAGQMRSFSIAGPSMQRAGPQVQSARRECRPDQARRDRTEKENELGGDEPSRAQIFIERTLQQQQQQQQQEERAEEETERAGQDHTAASTRTLTADDGVTALAEQEQTKQNKGERLGPMGIEKEMASVNRGQPLLTADNANLLDGKLNQRLETTRESNTFESKQNTTFIKTKISTTTTTTKPQSEQKAKTGAQQQQQQQHQQHQHESKEEWFRQMYKQMHRPIGATMTAEKSLLEAVNQANQREQADASTTGCIKIKLKSPRSDHHQEPSYFSEEDLERGPASPAFNGTKPGNICDYLPGQSSISQHERNLLLYHKLIDHINRVFSSVLVQQQDAPAATSRSTNALALVGGKYKESCQQRSSAYYEPDDYRARSHSMRRTGRAQRRRSSSGGRPGTHKKRKQLAQMSRSGPQTPANSKQIGPATACSPAYHIRAARLNDETTVSTTTTTTSDEHERRCVFNKLLRDDNNHDDDDNQQRAYESDQDREQADNLDNDELDEDNKSRRAKDPRKQYVAVQQGHDIPLKGLRKPAPQPNIYRVGPAPPVPMLSFDNNQLARQQYREHNLRLAQTLGRTPPRLYNVNNSMPRRRAPDTNELHVEDLYRDFENIYSHLCATKPIVSAGRTNNQLGPSSPRAANQSAAVWSSEAKFETMALNESLADVERALRRASGGPASGGGQPSMIVSPNPSEQTNSCGGRGDSRNTERSLPLNGGPALVEEMTLSDLEDEICSTLMAAKDAERQRRYHLLLEGTAANQQRSSSARPALPPALGAQFLHAGEQLLNGRRSRAPISNAISSNFKFSQARKF